MEKRSSDRMRWFYILSIDIGRFSVEDLAW